VFVAFFWWNLSDFARWSEYHSSFVGVSLVNGMHVFFFFFFFVFHLLFLALWIAMFRNRSLLCLGYFHDIWNLSFWKGISMRPPVEFFLSRTSKIFCLWNVCWLRHFSLSLCTLFYFSLAQFGFFVSLQGNLTENELQKQDSFSYFPYEEKASTPPPVGNFVDAWADFHAPNPNPNPVKVPNPNPMGYTFSTLHRAPSKRIDFILFRNSTSQRTTTQKDTNGVNGVYTHWNTKNSSDIHNLNPIYISHTRTSRGNVFARVCVCVCVCVWKCVWKVFFDMWI